MCQSKLPANMLDVAHVKNRYTFCKIHVAFPFVILKENAFVFCFVFSNIITHWTLEDEYAILSYILSGFK